MPSLSLRSLLSRRSASAEVVRDLCEALGEDLTIRDASGAPLLGSSPNQVAASIKSHAVLQAGSTLGDVIGSDAKAQVLSNLLSHLAERESEQRALATETLNLYREIHLIEQLSEELAAMLQAPAIAESALAQARRLIPASCGVVVLQPELSGPLELSASFCSLAEASAGVPLALAPDSRFVASVFERGVAEIVNACNEDPRAQAAEKHLRSMLLAPLRNGENVIGAMILANTDADAPYTAANLKLLHTIALQTSTALRNAVLCAQMVESAQARAALAAEMHAASTVQQMLLQGASKPTPGFHVESVYLPASEVGGDFFFVQPGRDGSLLATIGDVSGKGLTAAMRVSMIFGALRREASEEPAEILFNLNNALLDQGQLGFTTACSMSIRANGEFTFANAGHIAPYISGVELTSESALPLGIVPDQNYTAVHGRLGLEDRVVLMSDGVPEARSQSEGLLGFDRLPRLTLLPASELADAARAFGQEDDITVLVLKRAG